MSNHQMRCGSCIYCEYRNRRYHCHKGRGDELTTTWQPACKAYVKAECPACSDRSRVIPRRMGIQWEG